MLIVLSNVKALEEDLVLVTTDVSVLNPFKVKKPFVVKEKKVFEEEGESCYSSKVVTDEDGVFWKEDEVSYATENTKHLGDVVYKHD